MAVASELQSASQGLAIGVSLIALFLGLHQWYERRARGDLSEPDALFFQRQDVRRWVGVGVLTALAALVYVGSWIQPRFQGDRQQNLVFLVVWLSVMALIVVSLAVAFWDWSATWRYAREKREALLKDHVDDLKSQLRVVAEAARRERESRPDEPSANDG